MVKDVFTDTIQIKINEKDTNEVTEKENSKETKEKPRLTDKSRAQRDKMTAGRGSSSTAAGRGGSPERAALSSPSVSALF
jgi:hypothetical protein